MSVGFLVDASPIIGAGRWYRCLNLAKNYKNKKVFFFSRFSLKKKISKLKILKLKAAKFDLNDLKSKILKNEIKTLIIDNYQFNLNLQKKN